MSSHLRKAVQAAERSDDCRQSGDLAAADAYRFGFLRSLHRFWARREERWRPGEELELALALAFLGALEGSRPLLPLIDLVLHADRGRYYARPIDFYNDNEE